ncbi:hypothetical protein COCOBI_12-4960 [Coccomyxa sp. Obi]|nr:hypothetical protein COCOBI_12-4960 [Coccomyxa sp. Obi]
MPTAQRVQHDPARQVVILEIADQWSKQHIKNHFERHLAHIAFTGPGSRVVDAYIVCPGHGKAPHKYGFVVLATSELATAAMSLHGTMLHNAEVKLARPRAFRPEKAPHTAPSTGSNLPTGVSMPLHSLPMGSKIEDTGSSASKAESRQKNKDWLEFQGLPPCVSSASAPTLGAWGDPQQEAEHEGESGWDAGSPFSLSSSSIGQPQGSASLKTPAADSSAVGATAPLASQSQQAAGFSFDNEHASAHASLLASVKPPTYTGNEMVQETEVSKHAVAATLLNNLKAVDKDFWGALWPDLHGAGWTEQDQVMGSGFIITPPSIQGMQLPAMGSIREVLERLEEYPHLLQPLRQPVLQDDQAPDGRKAIHNLARAGATLPQVPLVYPVQQQLQQQQSYSSQVPADASEAGEDFVTPAKVAKVPGHNLSPPSVEGAEEKRFKKGRSPYSPPEERQDALGSGQC